MAAPDRAKDPKRRYKPEMMDERLDPEFNEEYLLEMGGVKALMDDRKERGLNR